MDIKDLMQTMAEHLSATASARNVYGDPVTVGDCTVIPVAEVRYGFGAGGGKRKEATGESGGGGGGKVSARPCGALEITPRGTRFIAFADRNRMGAALALGFVLGAAVVALRGPRRIEIARRAE